MRQPRFRVARLLIPLSALALILAAGLLLGGAAAAPSGPRTLTPAELSEAAAATPERYFSRGAVVADLRQCLAERGPDLKSACAFVAGDLRVSEAIPELVAALRRGDVSLRANAAWALGRMQTLGGEDALIQALSRDPQEEVRGMAAIALGSIGSRKALTLLNGKAWDDDSEIVQTDAVVGISRVADPGSLGSLRRIHKDHPLKIVRLAAATGLIRLGHTAEGYATIEQFLSDPDFWVRRNAALALADELHVTPLQLEQPGFDGVMAALRTQLREDPEFSVRAEVALALALMGDTEGESVLHESVAMRTGDVVTRQEAEVCPAASQLTSLAEPLVDAALDESRHDGQRVFAVWGLTMLKKPETWKGIEPLLASRNVMLRQTTAWAAGDIGDPGAIPALKVLTAQSNDFVAALKARASILKLRATAG